MMMRLYRIFFDFVITRRYRITIIGEELLKKKGGKLILPNHQSHVDPQMIGIKFYKFVDIVPVVNESFFKIPVVRYFFKQWGAIPVAEFKKGNRDPNVLKNIFADVNKALNEGRAPIIYPSGQLQDIGIETIRNKQSAYTVVSNLGDNSRVLGVRVKGLWGSMFSKAWTGKQPPFLPVFLKGIFFWLANLIFFCPKRNVTLEIVDITDEAREHAKGDRRAFNTYLEGFYNVNGIEEPTYIKHFFFFPKLKRKLPESIAEKYKKMKEAAVK
ncbi:MAG: lysophospholipid acyltransferase family protein [Crocinitomicaceae bacterium]|nr:lysophospholipid acyltransferase family protein [Crocinitomicaceae bacterium]